MEKEKTEKYEKQLMQQKAELMGLKMEDQNLTTQGLAEKMEALQVLQEENVINLMARKNEAHIRQIDLALSRIQDGTYGECSDCGVDISEKRLNARPEAHMCIECQQEREESLKKVV
tara:strand:+ start:2964 stop:3314 length:351 start_codon:yes stop_codon:yes gene_type:complete